MEWYSRYAISWELSNTEDLRFYLEALCRDLWTSKPGIFNMDQVMQFTADGFTALLNEKKVKISMDGPGRLYYNIFVEWLRQTVNYEKVYLHGYLIASGAKQFLEAYFRFYDTERLHQSLERRTPYKVYFGHSANKKIFELVNLNA